jgi:hypothetical protein
VCKVFLGVPTVVDVHADVGVIRNLDLQHLRIFLGRDNFHLSYVWDGWPVAQLPFLALGILQPVGRLEISTHYGVLPESNILQEFLERRLWRDPYKPSHLNSGLKICRMQNFLGSKKRLSFVLVLHVRPIGWSGTEKFGLLQNALHGMSRVLRSKCPECEPCRRTKNKE